MSERLPLPYPKDRAALIRAEVITDKHGSPMFYVYADGRCIDQGISGRAREAGKTAADQCVEYVREKWGIEPKTRTR